MFVDKNNNLWVATEGDGLVQIVNESIKNIIILKALQKLPWRGLFLPY